MIWIVFERQREREREGEREREEHIQYTMAEDGQWRV